MGDEAKAKALAAARADILVATAEAANQGKATLAA
jgi:FMN-dependent NADH-azoreductase